MKKEKTEGKSSEKEVKKSDLLNKCIKGCKKNPWMIVSVVLLVALLVVAFVPFGNASKSVVGAKVVAFAESQGVSASLVSIDSNGNFYDVVLDVNGRPIPLQVTKDGKFLVQATALEVSTTQTQQASNVPKSDKPVVELFVMTHCPYGTQAEKGFLPAIAELGDSIDASIKFTHFFLHEPEYTETPVQICIREEQSEKFAPYLTCFLEDGDTDRCLEEIGIDQDKMQNCIDNKYDDYYKEDSVLSEGYGVRGSPTLVINGVQASTGRSEAAMLATICSAFNEAPDACSSELNTANPTPGFGWETGNSAAAATASC